MFCTKCGNRIVGDEKFCTNCGAPIEQSKDIVRKKVKQNYKKIYVIATVLILVFAAVFILKKVNVQKNTDVKDEKITTEEAVVENVEAEVETEEESIDYSERYNNLIYNQIGVVTERELEIYDEDIVLNGDFYYVNNPNKENYLGILGSKLTDLNQDGEKEVFAVCMDEENYGNEKKLRISLKSYDWNKGGGVQEHLPIATPGMNQPYIIVELWDLTDADFDYQRRIYSETYYTQNGNIPYILSVGKKEGKYVEEYEISIYAKQKNSERIYRKLGYTWEFGTSEPKIGYEEYDENGDFLESDNAFGINEKFYNILNSMTNRLVEYGVNITVANDAITIGSYGGQCENIASVTILPNNLGKISGYQMLLVGNIIPADKEMSVENSESIQEEQLPGRDRTTVNYQREHEISEYEDLMLTMEACFWEEAVENINDIEDISSYIACFVPYDYPYEIYESWYNTETSVYEVSGEIVRKTMNKYFAFRDLKLEEHLPVTPNHDQGNYWYDKEKDMYYGWIGGFGGIHDGYQDINFEILDYGLVKAIGTWTLEDGSLATTEIVVEEGEDGLMRIRSYKHFVGETVAYSLAELEQMALEYRKRHELFECNVAVDNEMGDMVLIHCYEFVVDNPATGEGHTATSDWYTVNRYTAIGTNDAGEYIDLKN